MRDYEKPLTIVLTGTGSSTKANTTALLEDFIFGNLPGDAKVDIKMVVPYDHSISNGLVTAITVLKDWGIDEADFIPIVEPDCGHKSLTSAFTTIQVEQGDAVQAAIHILHEDMDAGRNVAFISVYDPASTKDLTDIELAKQNEWLTTLNLAEGLIDSFEGYETIEDKLKREGAVAEFERQVLANEVGGEIVSAKPVKKATAPRKRAATKVLVPEDVPLVEEPEKAVVEPQKPKPAAGLIAAAVAREAEKKAARELSGTIAMKSQLPKDLEPAKLLDATPDVWKDVAVAVPTMPDSVTVSKADIAQLGDAMQKMAEGFSDAIAVYKNIVENN